MAPTTYGAKSTRVSFDSLVSPVPGSAGPAGEEESPGVAVAAGAEDGAVPAPGGACPWTAATVELPAGAAVAGRTATVLSARTAAKTAKALVILRCICSPWFSGPGGQILAVASLVVAALGSGVSRR
jgi:hypothetical protein